MAYWPVINMKLEYIARIEKCTQTWDSQLLVQWCRQKSDEIGNFRRSELSFV